MSRVCGSPSGRGASDAERIVLPSERKEHGDPDDLGTASASGILAGLPSLDERLPRHAQFGARVTVKQREAFASGQYPDLGEPDSRRHTTHRELARPNLASIVSANAAILRQKGRRLFMNSTGAP